METESNVRRMTALMAFIDAAVRGGPPAMVELDGVIERALRLVAPALGRVAVSFNKPSHIQVRNEGTALECLIAGLIVELARAGTETRDPIYRQQIDVFADVGRGAIVLEIDSSGRRPAPGSWRIALARELAARLGASVTRRAPARGSSSGSIPAPSRANSRPSPWGWVSWPGTFLFDRGGRRSLRALWSPAPPGSLRAGKATLRSLQASVPRPGPGPGGSKRECLSRSVISSGHVSARASRSWRAFSHPPVMKVRFWGVRGSLPVPGAKTERYGGNTSCVEVRSAAGTRVIVDAGTGHPQARQGAGRRGRGRAARASTC